MQQGLWALAVIEAAEALVEQAVLLVERRWPDGHGSCCCQTSTEPQHTLAKLPLHLHLLALQAITISSDSTRPRSAFC